MGWNEPGSGKDPWGRPPGGGRSPDLDELLGRLRQRLGARPGGGGSAASMLATAVALAWLLSGIYVVGPAERGVVLQFGKYSHVTEQGLHWHLPFPVESVRKVNIEQLQTLADHASMLTQDQNIINLDWSVQYRISDARQYLFNVHEPEKALQEAARSALRDAVGGSKVDDVVYGNRVKIVDNARINLQKMLNDDKSGVQVTGFKLQDVQSPQPVQQAFADVTKAREEEKAKLIDVQAYANTILPQARGEAIRQVQEAEGYRVRITERAKGETARFLALLVEYEKNPQVTRKRLYLDTMESILGQTSKVVVDARPGSNPTIYLPLDQLFKQSPAATEPPKAAPVPGATGAPAKPAAGAAPPVDDYRGRERAR